MGRLTRRSVVGALALGGAIGTPRFGFASGGAATIRVGGGDFLTLAAQRLGLFERLGLTMQLAPLSGSKAIRSALETGTIDLADYGLDNALAVPGAAIIYQSDCTAPALVVQPGIRRLSQLRGAALRVDSRDTQNALALQAILRASGLIVDRDCRFVEAGPTPKRLAQMLADPSAAGTMAAGPQLSEARASGLRLLAMAEPLTGRLPYYGGFILRAWAGTEPLALPRFIAGKILAARWARSAPAACVSTLMQELLKISSVAARDSCSEGRRRSGWRPDCLVDEPSIANAIRLRSSITGQWGARPPSPQSLIEPRFHIAARQLVLARLSRGAGQAK